MEVRGEMGKGARQRWSLRRNWKSFLAGCFGCALLGATIAIVALNTSDATRLAVVTATSNAELIERLGKPIKTGWFIVGGMEMTADNGKADLENPISGPKGKGTLYALAVKTAGVWGLTSLKFGANGSSNRLDLLQQ